MKHIPMNIINVIKHPFRNFILGFLGFFAITGNVPALGEVANFGTAYFLLKIKFLAKCKREFITKFAILPNACYRLAFLF